MTYSTLVEFLTRVTTGGAEARRILHSGAVSVNGESVAAGADVRLRDGDIVRVGHRRLFVFDSITASEADA